MKEPVNLERLPSPTVSFPDLWMICPEYAKTFISIRLWQIVPGVPIVTPPVVYGVAI